MATFILAFAIIALSLAGLALGLAFGRRPLKGSCGAAACAGLGNCAACRRDGKDTHEGRRHG